MRWVCIYEEATINLNHGTGGDANDRDVIKDGLGRPSLLSYSGNTLAFIERGCQSDHTRGAGGLTAVSSLKGCRY